MCFLCLIGFSVYPVLLCGSFSKSKYGMLGSLRSGCQRISYEIVFSLCMFCVFMHLNCFGIVPFFSYSNLILISPFIIIILSELNRAPFDLSEGESELVSGFNIEYSRVSFILFFLSEYGNILYLGYIMSTLFFDSDLFMIYLIYCVLILIRRAYPRFRYDKIMKLFWLMILPIILVLFVFYFSMLS